MLEVLPISFLSSRLMTNFNVKLRGELFAADQVMIEAVIQDNGDVLHQLKKHDELIATGISNWQKV